MRRIVGVAVLAVVGMALEAGAIRDKDNQGCWNKPTPFGPDKEVPGFLVNLGPTGARAILTERTFIVKYIFKGSPAEGRLKIDDVITGIVAGPGKGSPVEGRPKNNDVATGPGKAPPAEEKPKNENVVRGGSGIPFSKHTFGGTPFSGLHGYEGPIMDLGNAIEKAEGKDGKLVLDVLRGTEKVEVTIPLEPIGSFSPTYPLNCKKSELLRGRALKYLAANPESFRAHSYINAAVTLAFLAYGDEAIGKRLALAWNTPPGPATWTWDVSYQLITLGEYYLLTQDATVLPTIKACVAMLRQDQYDGQIPHAPAKPGEDPKALDERYNLYRGGFAHEPFFPVDYQKQGYGAMQFPTVLAVIAWQIAERCGVKADPKGMQLAFDYIHYGTNDSGYVGYGGEYAMGNTDPAAWKKETGGTISGGDYVGRSGAAFVAHKLSPEFPASIGYMEKYKAWLKRAYKSLPSGHADSTFGIFWGLMGAGASDDESILRTHFDYHKAWFNMMRCHDGSFVVLPGRDYADVAYYFSPHASRYSPTAHMVLILGLGYPRLQIQGLQVSIPNVNPKALVGPRLAAYQAIVAKNYGAAARLVDAADPMSTWLDTQAKRVVDGLRLLDKAGRWLDLRDKIVELKKSYAGVPRFDEEAGPLEVSAKPFLASDKLLREGQPAKALAALSTPSPALEARIRVAAAEIGTYWTTLLNEGRWSTLKKEVDSSRERVKGLVDLEAFDAPLSSEAGRPMSEADRLCGEGAFGPAMTALGTLDSVPAKALRTRIQDGAAKVIGDLEALEKEGRWHSLRDALGKAKPKLGVLMEAQAKAWDAALSSPGSSGWVEAEKQYVKGDLGAAAKGAAPGLKPKIEQAVQERLKQLSALEAKGDWYGLSRELALQRKKLAGISSFDEKDAAWQAAFKNEPAKTALRLGAVWARVKEMGKRKDVEAFIQQAGEGFYAKEAKEFLQTLK